MDEPDQIGPDHSPKRTLGERLRRFVKAFTTKYASRWYQSERITANADPTGKD